MLTPISNIFNWTDVLSTIPKEHRAKCDDAFNDALQGREVRHFNLSDSYNFDSLPGEVKQALRDNLPAGVTSFTIHWNR